MMNRFLKGLLAGVLAGIVAFIGTEQVAKAFEDQIIQRAVYMARNEGNVDDLARLRAMGIDPNGPPPSSPWLVAAEWLAGAIGVPLVVLILGRRLLQREPRADDE
jgi:hypothetical protein